MVATFAQPRIASELVMPPIPVGWYSCEWFDAAGIFHRRAFRSEASAILFAGEDMRGVVVRTASGMITWTERDPIPAWIWEHPGTKRLMADLERQWTRKPDADADDSEDENDTGHDGIFA